MTMKRKSPADSRHGAIANAASWDLARQHTECQRPWPMLYRWVSPQRPRLRWGGHLMRRELLDKVPGLVYACRYPRRTWLPRNSDTRPNAPNAHAPKHDCYLKRAPF